jgi:hypothetical protein
VVSVFVMRSNLGPVFVKFGQMLSTAEIYCHQISLGRWLNFKIGQTVCEVHCKIDY